MLTRGVQRELDEIQGTRQLRDRLIRTPGYANLAEEKQRLLRELLELSNPSRHNYANARALGGLSLRDVVSGLNLRPDSSMRAEMHVFERKLARDEQLQRLNTSKHIFKS